MNKTKTVDYKPGDEVAFATPSGMLYGTVSRVLGAGDTSAIEIQFEDGRKEIKKVRDRSLSLLRRRSGTSEAEERRKDAAQLKDFDIERIRRSETHRR
jgi:hypothetical protein